MHRKGTLMVVSLLLLVVFLTAYSQAKTNAIRQNVETLQTLGNQEDALDRKVIKLSYTSNSVKKENDTSIIKNQRLMSLVQEIESETNNLKKQLETAKEMQTHIQEEERKRKLAETKELRKNNSEVRIQSLSNQKTDGEWLNFTATFYNVGQVTASGRRLTAGVTVSVDPKVIPLGTWMEIKYPNGTIETRRADDTGGAVKGRKIDVYYPLSRKELLQLGKQKIQVRLLGSSK